MTEASPNFRNRIQEQPEGANHPPATMVDAAFLTPAQLAAVMQVDVRTVHTAIRTGRLRAVNWGSGQRTCYRINPADLRTLSDS